MDGRPERVEGTPRSPVPALHQKRVDACDVLEEGVGTLGRLHDVYKASI